MDYVKHKVMEAPKKIYVHVKKDKVLNTWSNEWIGDHDIEYIRKDAFIEKACEFWTKNQRGFVTYKDIVDFKNFMKGK